MDYEIVIPTAPKDYNKIKYTLKSAYNYLWPRPKAVRVIHAGDFPNDEILKVYFPNTEVSFIYEKNVLNLDSNLAKNFNRPPWIYQQFLKLFQDITNTDYYLVLDSDIILNKNIYINEPIFFLGIDQNHQPYFNYSLSTFGFEREYNHSFISEMMLFNKTKCRELLSIFVDTCSHFGNVKYLYEYTCKNACNDWIPADYELYGNFIEKYYPNLYRKVRIQTNLKGKYSNWTDEELEQYIREMEDMNHDTFTAHTWI